LTMVEKMAQPGVRCRDVYAAAEEMARGATGNGFAHHLGHGTGLQPHEFPHLNPRWDDVLMEGEIVTVEPGVYDDSLRGGVRLENQYLVTRDGLRNLYSSPLEL